MTTSQDSALVPPRKLTEEQRDHIYDLSMHKPHTKIRHLLDEVDNVKERSIRGLLNEMGRRKWKQLKRPEIHEIHAQKTCLGSSLREEVALRLSGHSAVHQSNLRRKMSLHTGLERQ